LHIRGSPKRATPLRLRLHHKACGCFDGRLKALTGFAKMDEESDVMATNKGTLRCISTILILLSCWSVAYPSNGFAQPPLRNVNGIVTDQHRVPLKGAVVQVRNVETNQVQSYITGLDGRYSFKRLEGDTDYRIWAKVHGRQSRTRSLSMFDSNGAKAINFTISFQ